MAAIPQTTKAVLHPDQRIKAVTIGGARAAPRRDALCVMPWIYPKRCGGYQLRIACVAAGKAGPSPIPTSDRATKSVARPPASPVAIVPAPTITTHTVKVDFAPNFLAPHPPNITEPR